MKVKDLIELLKGEDMEKEVVMSKDGEGNGFSPLSDVAHALYVPDSTWSGEVYNTDEKEEAGEEAKEVVILWPTN